MTIYEQQGFNAPAHTLSSMRDRVLVRKLAYLAAERMAPYKADTMIWHALWVLLTAQS